LLRLKKFFHVFIAACTLGLMASVISFTPVAAASIGSIVCNPSSGAPGQTITVTGTVSGALTSYGYIGFDSQSNVVGSVTITGSYFSGTFTVPTGASTGVHYLYVVIDGTPGSTTFSVAANFALSASTGSVGDTVTVTGNGFTAYATVPLYWDSATTPFTTLTATASGTISGSITIPEGRRGAHTISSTAGTTGQTFTILSKITINPTTGGSGDSIAVAGTGFAPSSTIILSWDGTTLTTSPATVTSSTNGTFSCTITVPSSYRGDHTLRASDPGGYAVVNFGVVQNITLSATSASVGGTLVISGRSFAPNQNITFTLDGAALTTTPSSVVAASDGSFTNVSFTVPALTGGTHTVRATDQSGNYAEKTFTINAGIEVVTPAPVGSADAKGPVGTQITVEGSGFTPGATVAIQWDNAALSPSVTTTASSSGTISVSFVAPASKNGAHTIKAVEGSNVATTNFDITANITLDPSEGGYNDTITATFTGFKANSTITATIKSGSKTYKITMTPATVQADANGSATATFAVSPVPAGDWTIEAQGTSGESASATLTITPKLILGVTTGSAGDIISVTGTGFAASRSVTFTYGGAAISNSATSDANGSFTYQFTVPETTAGTIALQASDGTNVAAINFEATATAAPSTATSQSSPGYVGMDMTISGKGFKANSTVTITIESTPITVTTVTSNANGSFTATFKMPALAAGAHTIKASDGTTTKEMAFFMDSTAPAAPTLKTPVTDKKAKQPVAFTWNPVDDASGVTYVLQISQDAAFGSLVVEQKSGLTDTTYTMTDEEKLGNSGSNTPYYWRVLAVDNAGNIGSWSTASTFTIGFIWPSWMVHVWYVLGIIVALIFGVWFGRRMAYQSY
jgi:hypothetical protein